MSSPPLMADVYVKMDDDGDFSTKCREARRRRIEMRRFSSSAGEAAELVVNAAESSEKKESEGSDSENNERKRRTVGYDPPLRFSPPPPSVEAGAGAGAEGFTVASGPSSGRDPLPDLQLGFGSVSISGRSRVMEDAISVRPWFFRPVGGSPLHFFAVFDGHGGTHVSELCVEQMYVLLSEELTRMPAPATGVMEEDALRAAVKRCFGLVDELALSACLCGRVGRQPCWCGRPGFASEFVGSTAVVALVDRDRIVVANCGDSRAVLSRGGRAVPMSEDHKPDRPDELARIQAAGGRVIYLNGARVDGILAMSRAIGDKYFKPVVISEPEIRIMDRHPQDDCLIIASDGLWDVVPNDLACNVARRCLAEGDRDGRSGESIEGGGRGGEEHPSQARCNLAAALLARLALGRNSADNISVIVIDLK